MPPSRLSSQTSSTSMLHTASYKTLLFNLKVCALPCLHALPVCPGAAERSSAAGVGCLFLAHQGAGAYAAPLPTSAAGVSISSSKAPLTRINVQDVSDMQQARFMESFESRHSDHSFTAAVVSALLL